MNALTVKPKYCARIAAKAKPVELRTWYTHYRGPLLICASAMGGEGFLPQGHALCLVNLVDVRPFSLEDSELAGFDSSILRDFIGYSWLLDNVQQIVPFPVKGKLNMYQVDAMPSILTPQLEKMDLLQYWASHGLCEYRNVDYTELIQTIPKALCHSEKQDIKFVDQSAIKRTKTIIKPPKQ